jgi:hypothetical protein
MTGGKSRYARNTNQTARKLTHYSEVLPVSQLGRAYRAKAIELLNFNMLRPRGFVRHCRRWIHYLLTWLTSLSCWGTGLLCRKRPPVRIVLLLPSDVNLVLGRSGKHIIQLPVVFHRRDPVLSQAIDRLLLFGCRNRDHLES